MSEPTLEYAPDVPIKSSKNAMVHQIIGGIRLLLIGVIIIAVVKFVLYKQMALLYPYLNPNLLLGLQLFGVFGFMLPGGLMVILCKYGIYLESGQRDNIPNPVKILYIITAVLACVGILGIRNGVKIMIALFSKPIEANVGENSFDREDAIRSYRIFLLAGSSYLLVFGLLLIGVIELMQVVTIDLVYPDITQNMLIGIEIWIWLCFMLPSIIYFLGGSLIKPKSSPNLLILFNKMIPIGSIMAMLSLFGLSIGSTLIQKRWMIQISEN